MKQHIRLKNWFYISLFILPLSLSAQKTYLETGVHGWKSLNYDKVITDTLDATFDTATATLYASPNGGYVSGNSTFGEKAKIQEYVVFADSSYLVEGFIYWFGYKSVSSLPADSSRITLVMYDMDSSGTLNGVARRIPKTILETKFLRVQDIDTNVLYDSAMTVWMLNTPRNVNRNYAPGIRFDSLYYKDTVALYSSTDGDAPFSGLSWEFWQGSWNTIDANWGLDIDFAVFPLVDFTGLDVMPLPGDAQLRASVFPLPASDSWNIKLDAVNSAELHCRLLNASGQLVQSYRRDVAEGEQILNFSAAEIPPGIYYLTLSYANGSNLGALKVVIEK